MALAGWLGPLVGPEQVDEARTRAILFTLLAVAMLAVVVWKIVRAIRSKKDDDDPRN